VTRWLIEGLVPAGALVTITDADDGDPQAMIDAGFDAVLHLGAADPATLSGEPFLFTVLWREALVPGRQPPSPFWVRWTGSGLVRVEEYAA
jgi:hypothetical protein